MANVLQNPNVISNTHLEVVDIAAAYMASLLNPSTVEQHMSADHLVGYSETSVEEADILITDDTIMSRKLRDGTIVTSTVGEIKNAIDKMASGKLKASERVGIIWCPKFREWAELDPESAKAEVTELARSQELGNNVIKKMIGLQQVPGKADARRSNNLKDSKQSETTLKQASLKKVNLTNLKVPVHQQTIPNKENIIPIINEVIGVDTIVHIKKVIRPDLPHKINESPSYEPAEPRAVQYEEESRSESIASESADSVTGASEKPVFIVSDVVEIEQQSGSEHQQNTYATELAVPNINIDGEQSVSLNSDEQLDAALTLVGFEAEPEDSLFTTQTFELELANSEATYSNAESESADKFDAETVSEAYESPIKQANIAVSIDSIDEIYPIISELPKLLVTVLTEATAFSKIDAVTVSESIRQFIDTVEQEITLIISELNVQGVDIAEQIELVMTTKFIELLVDLGLPENDLLIKKFLNILREAQATALHEAEQVNQSDVFHETKHGMSAVMSAVNKKMADLSAELARMMVAAA